MGKGKDGCPGIPMALSEEDMDAMAATAVGERLREKIAETVSPEAAGRDWAELSGYYTELTEIRGPREDLNVICAPDGAMGHPGYYMSSTARIALDGNILPVSPSLLDTDDDEHLAALSALQGVFIHELGHANHSDEMRPALNGEESEYATLLEEIRMEARAIDDRNADAVWLRAATRQIIMDGDQSPDDIQNRAHAARLAVLLEGRVASGTLKPEDIAEVTKALETIFTPEEMEELRDIFEKTCALQDHQTDEMTEQARRLRELIGEPPPSGQGGEGQGEGQGEGEGEGQGEGEGEGGGALTDKQKEDLSQAVSHVVENVSDEANEEIAQGPEGAELDKAAEQIKKNAGGKAAPGSPGGSDPGAGAPSGQAISVRMREPSDAERSARYRLTAMLRKARYRDRDKVELQADAPPGKLRTRAAMQGAADKSRGRRSAAKPWKRNRRRQTDQPKLRVGLVMDVSGSMHASAPTVSSAMWVLANSVHDIDGQAAGYSFGDSWDTIVGAERRPRQVTEFRGEHGTMNPGAAIQKAVADLDLDQPGPRVLVVVSDGGWYGDDSPTGDLGDAELQKLKDDGVVVLHVNVGHEPSEHPASRTCVLGSVEEIPEVIGQACLEELQKA